ncbi:hypothetical protein BpHYR1_051322 [Brachionus plicatilis]|uniref:Uncharacterized protein n=1 Tax=Brachionus plicatilis TaxID=10195 RepID=A0A3M7PV50_BRAPC|nr:hypothetical protein BpHYR1_051322 [Brachionus plicatilis]
MIKLKFFLIAIFILTVLKKFSRTCSTASQNSSCMKTDLNYFQSPNYHYKSDINRIYLLKNIKKEHILFYTWIDNEI